MLKKEITKLIHEVLEKKEITDVKIIVDYPADPKHGDYSSNVALIAAKKVGKNPMEFAEDLKKELEALHSDMFEKIEIAKPGFINFSLKVNTLISEIENESLPDVGKNRKVVVEYSSPNIAKPFTIGHLRSTIIGDAVANLLSATGWDVKRDNHVGDWGTQFGKQIYAIKAWGNESDIEKSERPVKELVALYVKFHEEAEKNPTLEDEAREWFKKLEDGDKEARALWQKCIDWSWKEFDAIYQQLGVTFTENNGRGYGEAFFENKMDAIVSELEEKHLMKEGKEGARIVEYADETKLPPLMILKKDGASLYATRDLATDKFRMDTYNDDNLLVINEVGAEQALYFRQLYKLEELLGWFQPGQRVHIKHGLYRFKEGKMSTRKGNVIWLEDVLEEAKKRAGELSKEGEEVSDLVAFGAIKWNDLKRTPEQDIAFEWDEVLNMQGNSGPYMQYTYVRTKSILDKAKEMGVSAFEFTYSGETNTEERDLLRLLTRFDEIVVEASVKFSPSTVATYLFELAQAFNLFYQKHPILKGDESNMQFRLMITSSVGKTIKQGISLLGIQVPQKM